MGGVVDEAGAGRERGVGPFYEGCLKQKEGEWETTKDEWCVTILGELLELSCKNRGRRKDMWPFAMTSSPAAVLVTQRSQAVWPVTQEDVT